jgi:hypothetical protein
MTGFKGYLTIGWLMQNGYSIIDDFPGVYKISRISCELPEFLEVGTGGWFKNRDLNVPINILRDKWVDGARTLYIGKAENSLRTRLRKYMSFGSGRPVAHKGGRYLWQLENSRDLIISWRVLPEDLEPGFVETELLKEFYSEHGRLPFANLRW